MCDACLAPLTPEIAEASAEFVMADHLHHRVVLLRVLVQGPIEVICDVDIRLIRVIERF
jgi:hypothetical protein